MIACVDVQYGDDEAAAAAVLFEAWTSAEPYSQYTELIECPAPYVPGEFYKRELPCILSVLKGLPCQPTTVLIDGYVWLDASETGSARPGLGAHLYDALDRKIVVVGVAKSHFKDASAISVYRGKSDRPIYVSSADIDVEEAAKFVKQMHGKHRLPTLIKLADRLARQALRGQLFNHA